MSCSSVEGVKKWERLDEDSMYHVGDDPAKDPQEVGNGSLCGEGSFVFSQAGPGVSLTKLMNDTSSPFSYTPSKSLLELLPVNFGPEIDRDGPESIGCSFLKSSSAS
jgi:hypothetical protein